MLPSVLERKIMGPSSAGASFAQSSRGLIKITMLNDDKLGGKKKKLGSNPIHPKTSPNVARI